MATASKAAATRTAAPKPAATASSTAATASSAPQRRRSPKTPQEPKTMTEQSTTNGKTATLNLPFVTAQFRRPQVHLPGRMPHVPRPHVHLPSRPGLPPREQMLYYGGLGALAALEMIDWPVALAVGAGTVVAQRARRGREPKTPQRSESPRTSETAGKSTTE